jgi:hypothetical protein
MPKYLKMGTYKEKRFIWLTVLETESPKSGSHIFQPLTMVPLAVSHQGGWHHEGAQKRGRGHMVR